MPYAELKDAQSGANIGNEKNRRELYYKLCTTALVSARAHNGIQTEVAFVTNVEVPKPYSEILEKNNISVIKHEFDSFYFGKDYKWCLAFYKLCAFEYVVNNLDYDFYAYMDSDVYIKDNFDNIWEECSDNIMLYDFNSGLNEKFYRRFLGEAAAFTGEKRIITHFGGEFCACNRGNAQKLAKNMRDCFEEMLERNFETKAGDEFILSVSADKLRSIVKNAGAYVFRFWTGDYRIVSTAYRYSSNMVVLHCPQEKKRGLLKIYDKYISKGRLPSNDRVYGILHLNHRRLRVWFSAIKARIVSKFPNIEKT